MALPRELYPFTFNRGDFLYRTANEAEWARLPSALDDPKHNCRGVKFHSGVVLTQKHHLHGSVCNLKLILYSPAITTEDDEITVEAACVEIGHPVFMATQNCEDKARAIEHAKTLPLAQLDKTITAVKLRNLHKRDVTRWRRSRMPDNDELGEWIRALIDDGHRTVSATQTNGYGPRQTEGFCIPPQPSSSSTEASADDRTLEERLQIHQVATAQGEMWLRQDLEDDRQAMLWTVTAALNGQWDQRVAAAVAKYRAEAARVMQGIVAQENVWDGESDEL